MIDLRHDGDVASVDSDPPDAAPLRASINAFVASLAAAHPCIFTRSPADGVEDVAALLHMSLDHCRDLLAAYDFLMSADAVWVFEPHGGEGDDDGEDDHDAGDDEDIPF